MKFKQPAQVAEKSDWDQQFFASSILWMSI